MKKVLFVICFLLITVLAFATVNINTATVKQLTTLKGVGEKKAEAIVKYRKEHGKFKKVDELAKVKGIGSKMVNKLSKDIVVK